MASGSTVISPAAILAPPNPIRICFKEAKYEFLKALRFPIYFVSTVIVPLMFYVLFGLVMGRQSIGGLTAAAYLIPAYGTFGVMGASLFGTAAGPAGDRGMGVAAREKSQPYAALRVFSCQNGYEPDLQYD